MALVLKDRVQETATANTTVSFSLAGAVTGFQAFSTIGNTNTTYYSATDASGNWETGIGTYSTTGNLLTRTTILSSSNSGSAVTFSGTVNVFVTYPATKSINLNESNNLQLDFSNATLTSRNSFQTSTVNSSTGIYALPNGTSTDASWQATNNSNPTNASKVLISTNGSTDVQLVSGINGTGTYLPLAFYNNGVGRFVIGTSGQFGIGQTATVAYGTSGQVFTSGGNASAPSWSSVVNSAVAGTGISVSAGTGNVTITNSGVTSVDSTTGAITLANLAAFTRSLGSSGYMTFPGGLKLVWAPQTTSSTNLAVTFPSSFTTVYGIVGGISAGGYFRASSLTTTGFQWTPGSAAATGWYMAFGV